LTKYVSVASLVSLAVITALAFEEFGFMAGLLFLSFLILNVVMHRTNINRLLHDKENKTNLIEAFKKFGNKEN
jgi:glycerol-3-phosphate acyltransferase PlsY